MTAYALALGANLGDRDGQIAAALRLLGDDGLVRIAAVSPLIDCAAVGCRESQPPYRNGAAVVETGLGPHQLLHRCQAVETALGRCRERPLAARTIDLDLVLADDGRVVASGVLILPHPRLALRPFVLGPLAAIAPHWRHPLLGCTVAELAGRSG